MFIRDSCFLEYYQYIWICQMPTTLELCWLHITTTNFCLCYVFNLLGDGRGWWTDYKTFKDGWRETLMLRARMMGSLGFIRNYSVFVVCGERFFRVSALGGADFEIIPTNNVCLLSTFERAHFRLPHVLAAPPWQASSTGSKVTMREMEIPYQREQASPQ